MEEAGEDDRPDSVASKIDRKEPKQTNQFNFSERSSQTLNNPLRVRKVVKLHICTSVMFILIHLTIILIKMLS